MINVLVENIVKNYEFLIKNIVLTEKLDTVKFGHNEQNIQSECPFLHKSKQFEKNLVIT